MRFLSTDGIEVVRNPSGADIRRMVEASPGGSLRACKDMRNGDLYVWDAAASTHRPMIERLGLEMGDSAGFFSRNGRRIIQHF